MRKWWLLEGGICLLACGIAVYEGYHVGVWAGDVNLVFRWLLPRICSLVSALAPRLFCDPRGADLLSATLVGGRATLAASSMVSFPRSRTVVIALSSLKGSGEAV